MWFIFQSQEMTMNWFPALAASAVAAVTFLGTANPVRALPLLLSLSGAIIVWMAREGWRMRRLSPLRTSARDSDRR